jgi:hypothetical protein
MSQVIDAVTKYLAHRRGLLPLLGCLLVLANFVVRVAFPGSWMAASDFLLHLGVLIGILGLLLARVL